MSQSDHKTEKKIWFYRLLRFSIAVGIAVLLSQINLDYLEALTYDLRMKYQPVSAPSGHIVTVAIDTKTRQVLERYPNARDHQIFIEKLLELQPRAVVYLVDPNQFLGSTEDKQRFAHSAVQLPFYIADEHRFPLKGLDNELRLPAPLDILNVVSAPRSRDQRNFAKDGVTRRFVLSFRDQLLLHPLLANTFNNFSTLEDYSGTFQFKRTQQGYINYRPQNSYPALSFFDVLESRIPLNHLHDKIILIGKDDHSDTGDYSLTPFSRDVLAMSNLEVHANILDTLIQDFSLSRAPSWINLLLTSLISILTVYAIINITPIKGLGVLIGTLFLYSLFSFFMFSSFQIWLPMAHPFLAVFICYYFFIPYRLIVENRKSWDYFHRNQLLTQVEELKSNFLRMMSHDLKTPLARIQGMTDLVMRNSERLNPEQHKALRSINQSSQELSDFIGSILSLGRIESKEIKLHLKSKDINTLLNEVISKCEYLAKERSIQILTEFEPMFSMKLDTDLLHQVFTNLVENAIKYSPKSTKILVSTEEPDGRLIVQVADQGKGIPENEIENIFTKFYRSSQATSSKVKGSGLGLYLARYFVELHNGRISVESDTGKGSTFTVELPMNEPLVPNSSIH